MKNALSFAAFGFAAVVFGLAGCGGGSSSTIGSVAPNMQFTVGLTSVWKNLYTLNNGVTMAGLNDLTGTATINGQSVKVEVLATVDYTNGSGPFGGTMELTFPDGSILGLSQNGLAQYASVNTTTTLTSPLSAIGGTGKYNNAVASGSYTGTRNTALGGPVQLSVALFVQTGA